MIGMFAAVAFVDDNERFEERVYESDQVTGDLLARLIRMLDGSRHTLLTI